MTITRSQVADRLRIEGHFFTKAAKEVDALVSEVERLREFARAAVVAFDLAAELMPDNVINFAQFAIDARAALTQEQ